MNKTSRVLLKAALGYAATAGIFCLGLVSCVAYGIKNKTVKNPLKKEEAPEEKDE
ncbi:MAG: hypothetical protein IJE09_00260 [Oscillospiraceae bacterium]|nr:hypothetical protein [Oscillospiraceae bacterium]